MSLDNGPVAKSRVLHTVMLAVGIAWQTYMAEGKDGPHVTARATGKVERPFRTVKDAHETLSHFHKPETEAQANAWLLPPGSCRLAPALQRAAAPVATPCTPG